MRPTVPHRRTILRIGLSAGLLGLFAIPALAHRQKKVQSTIEWNANTSSLEVTHLIHRHDAELALAALGKIDKPDLSSLKARAILALHIADQFALSDTESNKIELEIIGAENEGPHIYSYFEAKMDKPPSGLIIHNSIFQTFYSDQINHVNVHFGKVVKSAIFARGDKAKKVLA